MNPDRLNLFRFGEGAAPGGPAGAAAPSDANVSEENGAPAQEAETPGEDGRARAAEDAGPAQEVEADARADGANTAGGDEDDAAWRADARRIAYLTHACMETRRVYPDFDLKAELADPRFVRLVNRGASVREAYEIAHRDDLLRRAVAEVSEKVREDAYRAMSARRARPDENGAYAAILTRRDPAKMTRGERETLSKRALRGERVTL